MSLTLPLARPQAGPPTFPPPTRRLLSTPRGPSRLVFKQSFPAMAPSNLDAAASERRLRACLEGVSALAFAGYEEDEEEEEPGSWRDRLRKRQLKKKRPAIFFLGVVKILNKIRLAGRKLLFNTV